MARPPVAPFMFVSAVNLPLHHGSLCSTKMAELVLDPAIRLWVILPIVVITFLIGIIRHYLSILLQSKKDVDIQGVTDS